MAHVAVTCAVKEACGPAVTFGGLTGTTPLDASGRNVDHVYLAFSSSEVAQQHLLQRCISYACSITPAIACAAASSISAAAG
jgi:hypothetical protein